MANLIVSVTDAIIADPPTNIRMSGTAGIEGASTSRGWLIEVPFGLSVDELNERCIEAGIAEVAAHGGVVGPGDIKRLFGGALPNSALVEPARVAHVVMRGTTVDSVFVDALDNHNDGAAAAQARATQLAVASEGASQEDALRQAPWITQAPVNPT